METGRMNRQDREGAERNLDLRALGVSVVLAIAVVGCHKAPPPSYGFPVAPYPPNASPEWPGVPVGGTTPVPPPTATATSANGVAPLPSTPLVSVSAAPLAVGPLASADPEIDGPPDVAYVEVGSLSMTGG